MQWQKDFKLEILICSNSPITKHQAPLHQKPYNFHIPLPNWASEAEEECVRIRPSLSS
jgi:hypothetical protein